RTCFEIGGATGFASVLRAPFKSFGDRLRLDQLARNLGILESSTEPLSRKPSTRRALAKPVAPEFDLFSDFITRSKRLASHGISKIPTIRQRNHATGPSQANLAWRGRRRVGRLLADRGAHGDRHDRCLLGPVFETVANRGGL